MKIQSTFKVFLWLTVAFFLGIPTLVSCGTSGESSDPSLPSGNTAPVADAGPNQNVTTGSLVTLNGSGSSDADGDTLTFNWSFTSRPAGSSATLSNVASVNPSFTPDLDGDYVVRLVVNDGQENSAPDTVRVRASTGNSAPVADAGPDQNVTTGSRATLDGSGSSDADGDPLTFTWSFTSRPTGSSATLSNASAVNPFFTPDLDGDYVVRLVVNDGQESSTPDTVKITASTGNSAPVADAGPNQNVTTGSAVTLDGSGSSDADGDPLSFSWSFLFKPLGSTAVLSDPSIINPTFTPDRNGIYVVRLFVHDGVESSAPDTAWITASTDNSAPVADAGPNQNVTTGSQVTMDGSGSSDADGDPLTFAWSFVSRPAGSSAVLSNPSVVDPTFTPDLDGTYTIRLTVNDGSLESAPDTVNVTASSDNSAPVADAGPDQNVTTGALVALDGSLSSDADSDPLTFGWSFVSKPAGSSAVLSDPSAINPTFLSDEDGTYRARLVVNDGMEESMPDTVDVIASPDVPVPDNRILSNSGSVPGHKNFFSNQRKVVAVGTRIFFLAAGSGHLYCCISTNGGGSWQPYDLGLGSQGSIATDGARVYVFWCYGNTVRMNRFLHTATPSSSATVTLHDLGYPQQEDDNSGGPSSDIDEQGTVYLAWVGKSSNSPNNECTKWSKSTNQGQAWSPPENLSSTAYRSYRAHVMTDQDNHVHVAWTGQGAGVGTDQAWVVSSTNGGDAWSAPLLPHPTAGDQFNICMTCTQDGTLLLGFQEDNSAHVCRSTNGGSSWSHHVIDTNPTGLYCTDVQFAVDTQGFVYASYRKAIDGAYRFFLSRSTDQGINWQVWDSIYTDSLDRRAPCLRYSVWHNGGGSLMGGYELEEGTNRNMWFRKYSSVQIYQHVATTE